MSLPEKTPPTPEEIAEWDAIIDALRGTCDSLSDKASDELQNDDRFCAYVDENIFLCHQCGWWCEIAEESSEDYGLDEWTCEDCCMENAE